MTATATMTDSPMHGAGGEAAGVVPPALLALSAAEVEHFHREGWLVVEGVVTGAALEELREVTDQFLDRARELDASDGPIDLAPDHTRERPQVRRIIDPDRHHPAYAAATRRPSVLDVVCDLLGPDIRFDHSKLNCKPPGGGVPIEWHQDWAFYPQTNDRMLALSLMLASVQASEVGLMELAEIQAILWVYALVGAICFAALALNGGDLRRKDRP